MDAHLLRRIGLELAGQLIGAGVETVYRPVDAVFTFKLSPPARRPYLLVRHGPNPVCLPCLQKPDNPPAPDAAAMRLRKYLCGRRICGVWLDWERNALCLELAPRKTPDRATGPGTGGPEGTGRAAEAAADNPAAVDNAVEAGPAGNANPLSLCAPADPGMPAPAVPASPGGLFLCLDPRRGPRLSAGLSEGSEPLHRRLNRPWEIRAALAAASEPTSEPASDETDAARTQRRFPFLTPSLRAALARFSDPADALALLADLECAAGDVFAYGPPPSAPGQSTAAADNAAAPGSACAPAPPAWPRLCAWPLPADSARSRPERVYSTALEALEAELTPPFFNRLHRDRTDAATKARLRAEKRARRALDRLDAEDKRLRELFRLKEDALLLQASLYHLDKTARPAAISLPTPDGGQREIRLDSGKSLLENMERMFRQAAKAARGFPHVRRRRAELERTLRELQMKNPDLLPTAEALAEAPDPAKSRGKDHAGSARSARFGQSGNKAAPEPDHGALSRTVSRFQSPAGLTVLRGKNAKGNRDCLKMAAPYDLWLHAEGGPSAHVIIRLPHPAFAVPEADLEMAARLVAEKSRQREAGRADVICALVRHVHAVKGAPHGTVKVDRVWRTISVSPRKPS